MAGARYSLAAIDRLIDGEVYDENAHVWREVTGYYYALRSRMETVGDVESDYVSEVLDMDRALDALRRVNPVAAALVTLARDGWTIDELEDTFGSKLKTDPGKLLDKSTCFLRAYLNGATHGQALAAYRRGRKPVRWERGLPR